MERARRDQSEIPSYVSPTFGSKCSQLSPASISPSDVTYSTHAFSIFSSSPSDDASKVYGKAEDTIKPGESSHRRASYDDQRRAEATFVSPSIKTAATSSTHLSSDCENFSPSTATLSPFTENESIDNGSSESVEGKSNGAATDISQFNAAAFNVESCGESIPPKNLSRSPRDPATRAGASTVDVASPVKHEDMMSSPPQKVERNPAKFSEVSPAKKFNGDKRIQKKTENDKTMIPGFSELDDEWKQAVAPNGRPYFYNRRTRETKWKLPHGARLVSTSAKAHDDAAKQRREHITCDKKHLCRNSTTSLSSLHGDGKQSQQASFNNRNEEEKSSHYQVRSILRETNNEFLTTSKEEEEYRIHLDSRNVNQGKQASFKKLQDDRGAFETNDVFEKANISIGSNSDKVRDADRWDSFLENNRSKTVGLTRNDHPSATQKNSPTYSVEGDETKTDNFTFTPKDLFSMKNQPLDDSGRQPRTVHRRCRSDAQTKVFCVYCGTKLTILELEPHLSICSKSNFNDNSTKDLIEKALTSICRQRTHNCDDSETEDSDKENKPPKNWHTPTAPKSAKSDLSRKVLAEKLKMRMYLSAPSPGVSSYREGDSQGEDRMTGNSFRSKNEELDAKSLEAAVMSVCPFCAKALPRGNDLSRHLLQCSSRRKSKQRREVASLGEAGSPTPIQVLSASGEGRQLPGHPKPKTTST